MTHPRNWSSPSRFRWNTVSLISPAFLSGIKLKQKAKVVNPSSQGSCGFFKLILCIQDVVVVVVVIAVAVVVVVKLYHTLYHVAISIY